MRKLVFYVAVTLDGFIAGPDCGDPSGESYFRWTKSGRVHRGAVPETLPAAARQALGVARPGTEFETVLEGRAFYEVGLAAGVTNAYPHLRHLVFSTTMRQSPDPMVEMLSTDPLEQSGNLGQRTVWTCGSWAGASSPMRCCRRSTA